MKENEKYVKMLEEYDRTGHLPIEKTRRSFTLTRMPYNRLKQTSHKEGKSMSSLLEELIENKLCEMFIKDKCP